MRTGLLFLALGCGASDDVSLDKDAPTPSDDADTDTDTDADTDADSDADSDSDPITDPVLYDIVLNEVMPGNQSTLNAPDDDTKPDWVEIVNLGDVPVPGNSLFLRNAEGVQWRGAEADGELAPGARRLVYADIGDGSGGPYTGFPIDRDGDSVTLLSDGIVVETLEVPPTDADIALARIPDLTGAFAPTAWPSPGEPNGEASPTLNTANETLFRTDVVHEIAFTFLPDALAQIDEYERPEVHVGLDIDGIRYDDVGLKLKGQAAYDTMDGKPSFILDFNSWVTGTEFRGLKALKLHSVTRLDPTRIRDHLTYGLARELGLFAPRVGWAHVTVNGDDYGIYVLVERHDASMIRYHHPDQAETGVVMEPNETESGGFAIGDFGNGIADWNYEEGPIPMDPAVSAVLENIDALMGQPVTDARVDELFTWVDREKFLTYLAWEDVAMHVDGYRSQNNWRIYVDGNTHLVEWAPSGAEYTWDSNVSPFRSNGAVARWCLENEGCRRGYAEKLLLVADTVEDLDLAGEFETLSQFLDPWIQADPRYDAFQTVNQARNSTRTHLVDNPVDARIEVGLEYPDLLP